MELGKNQSQWYQIIKFKKKKKTILHTQWPWFDSESLPMLNALKLSAFDLGFFYLDHDSRGHETNRTMDNIVYQGIDIQQSNFPSMQNKRSEKKCSPQIFHHQYNFISVTFRRFSTVYQNISNNMLVKLKQNLLWSIRPELLL